MYKDPHCLFIETLYEKLKHVEMRKTSFTHKYCWKNILNSFPI